MDSGFTTTTTTVDTFERSRSLAESAGINSAVWNAWGTSIESANSTMRVGDQQKYQAFDNHFPRQASGAFSDDYAGILASGSDGFTILSEKTDSGDRKVKSTGDAYDRGVWYHQPIVEAQSLIKQSETKMLHHAASPYALESAPKGFPKCNIFLYDVMDRADIKLPLGAGHRRLTAHELNGALAKHQDFERVWCRDKNPHNWENDRVEFLKTFRPQDGDIAIWDNQFLEHTGLLEETMDGTGNIYYAGRDTESGLGYFNLKGWFVQSHTQGYGAPDAVYRYKHLRR